MSKLLILPEKKITDRIYMVRGQKVMLDQDLAELYDVETRRLNEQVKRNFDRFPEDFMFQLAENEYENLISQNATSSWGGRRKLPFAFTEQGVAMLSSVLNSEIAIRVNIQIIRIFTKMRELLLTHKDVLLKLETLEKKMLKQDDEIQLIFKALKRLLNPEQPPRKKIGFKRGSEE